MRTFNLKSRIISSSKYIKQSKIFINIFKYFKYYIKIFYGKKINNILKEKHNLKLKDFLNCRTFLDHNRIYRKPNKNINHKISTGGSFSFKGRLIPGKELITNFILHLLEWKKFIKAHGLIAVELHTLDPIVTLKNSGNSLACAYDATHGYSDQYLIEYEVYKKCILEIGMNITSDNEYLFPRKIPTFSINYII